MLRWAIRLTSQHQKGERKQTWNAWKPQRVKQEREEQRAALTAKEDALKEVMMLLDEIGPRTDYREAASMLRYERQLLPPPRNPLLRLCFYSSSTRDC